MKEAGWTPVSCHRKKTHANKTAKNVLRKYYERTSRGVMEVDVVKVNKSHCVFKKLTK